MDMPERMHVYNALIHRRHHLPVRSIVMLLRREAQSSNLTGRYACQFSGEPEYLVFHYAVIKLWEMPMKPFLEGGLGLLPFAALTDEAAQDLSGTLGKIDDRLVNEAEPKQAHKLRLASYVMLGLNYSQDQIDNVFKGITDMRESSTFQAILEEGRAKGNVEKAQEFVLVAGTEQFGQPDEQTQQKITSLTDPDHLKKLLIKCLKVSGWDELFSDQQ